MSGMKMDLRVLHGAVRLRRLGVSDRATGEAAKDLPRMRTVREGQVVSVTV